MTWAEHHRVSEDLAAEASEAMLRQDHAGARSYFAKAAAEEEIAVSELDPTKPRTLGISVVSAVALYYKASDLAGAERVAIRWLGSNLLPEFAVDQLRNLLQSIWSERIRERAQAGFAPGQVMISVRGGEVVEGGAPLDLIVEKVQIVQSLFYRTAELLRGLPYRRHGPPTREIQDTYKPWLFQAAPGSYQFAVAIQESKQADMFQISAPTRLDVAQHFLKLLRAGIEDPRGALAAEVPDVEYRGTFLRLTRNLAPSGKVFTQLEIRASDEMRGVRLEPELRRELGREIRGLRDADEAPEDHREALKGILRAIHLDKDWLEVTVGTTHTRVDGVSEQVDDVIGPMINKPVIVEVLVDAAGRKRFVDIERDD